MEWEAENPWEVGFSHAEAFFHKNGNLNVSTKYKSDDGYTLGSWIANQRNKHNNPREYHELSIEQSRRLEEIGMVWRPSDAAWMDGYKHAKEYLHTLHGERWKTSYVSPDGHKTGEWMRGQLRAKEKGTLTSEKETLLEECGLWSEIDAEKQPIKIINTCVTGGSKTPFCPVNGYQYKM